MWVTYPSLGSRVWVNLFCPEKRILWISRNRCISMGLTYLLKFLVDEVLMGGHGGHHGDILSIIVNQPEIKKV